MDESEARRILRTLRSELGEALLAVQAAERRASALNKLVEGYVELFPALTEEDGTEKVVSPEADRPRGQHAVRQVLTENPGRWYTVRLMTRELGERGWLPDSDQPENAVRTALTRIAETDPLVRRGVGEKTRQITFAWFDKPEPDLGHELPGLRDLPQADLPDTWPDALTQVVEKVAMEGNHPPRRRVSQAAAQEVDSP